MQKLEQFASASPANQQLLPSSVESWFPCADSLLQAWHSNFQQRPVADTLLHHLYPLAEAHFGRQHPDLISWQVYYGEAFALKRKNLLVDTLLNQVWQQFSQRQIDLTEAQSFSLYAALAIRKAHSAAYDEGIQYTKLAISVADRTPGLDSHLFPIVLNTLGSIYFNRGEYGEAIRMFQRAITEIGNKPEYASMQQAMKINLASSLMEHEALEEAEQLFAEISPSLGPEDSLLKGYIGFNRVILQEKMGHFEKAEDLLLKIKDHPLYTGSANGKVEWFSEYAHVLHQQKKWEPAIKAAHFAQMALDSNLTEYQILSFATDVEVENLLILANATHQKAQILYEMDQALGSQKDRLEAALRHYEQFANLIHRLKQYYLLEYDQVSLPDLLEGLGGKFHDAIACAFAYHQQVNQPHSIDRVFRLVEQSKALSLLERYRFWSTNPLGELDSVTVQKGLSLSRQLSRTKGEILEFQQESEPVPARLIEQELYHAHLWRVWLDSVSLHRPDWANINSLHPLVSLEEVQRYLRTQAPDALWIEYFWQNQDQFFVFVITPTEYRLIPVEIAAEFSTHLPEWKRRVNVYKDRDQPTDFALLSHTIYQQILASVEERYPLAGRRLLIVPDGPLFSVPFEALVPKKLTEPISYYSQVPYFCKTSSIQYVHSASLMLSLSQLQSPPLSSPTHLRGFGLAYSSSHTNLLPRGISSKWVPLPGSVIEIEELKAFLSGHYVFGEAEGEAAFKKWAPQSDIIHIAAHGTVENNEPLLVLWQGASKDGAEDGYLFPAEVERLSLRSKLTVLSTCKSGDGKTEIGEGVINFANTFFGAGSEAVVMNLWDASDEVSPKLMKQLYNFLNQGHSKDVSLQKAKIEFLSHHGKRFAHPSFWAGTVSWGNPAPLFEQAEDQQSHSGWIWLGLLSFLGMMLWLGNRRNPSLF